MKACRGCYKMLITIAAMLPVKLVSVDGSEQAWFPMQDSTAEFTPNHDECECCAGQVKRIREYHDKIIAERPGYWNEAFLRSTEVCCCK